MHQAVRATLFASLFLGGCASFQDYWAPQRAAVPAADIPVAERPVQEPVPANHFVIGSPRQSVVGVPQVVLTKSDDTLADIARAYGLGYDELLAANPDVDPWLPGEQTPVLLPTQFVLPDTAREGIVLNIASKRLFYYPRMPEGQPQVVKTYPIGIGRVGWETPLGAATVIAKAMNPTWYVPASVREEHAAMGDPLPSVVPPGPDNPLGTRVLQLDMPGYLIHGTNQPYGVGMRVSHGCVRLYPENIEFLYELVAIGESVQIVNEPYLLGELDGALYFEAHAPLEDDTIDGSARLDTMLAQLRTAGTHAFGRDTEQRIREIAGTAVGVPVLVSARAADNVMARARHVQNTVVEDPDEPTLLEVREMMEELLREAEAEAQAAADADFDDQS